MNFFEAQIERLSRILQRVEDNPSPKRLRSNRLLYELELEQRKSQLEAWQAGEPFAYFPPHLALPHALGFQWIPLFQGANRQAKEASRLLDLAQSLGLPRDSCDSPVMGAAMCMNGELPLPSFLIVHGVCDPTRLSQVLLAHWSHVPYFLLDIHLERNQDSLTYTTEQLEELIDYAQSKVPRIKYNQDRLIELQELDRVAYCIYRNIYELMKEVPCPMGVKDSIRNCPLPHEFPNPRKFTDYLRMLCDELTEKPNCIGEERLRVMWTTAAPIHGNLFSILERYGVSIPMFYIGPSLYTYSIGSAYYGDSQEYGRILSPLEEEARMLNYDGCAGKGDRWIMNAIMVCRELKIDAIINYNQVGCTATLGLQTVLEQSAEKELGIPTLQLYGRFLDSSYKNQKETESELENFINSCIEGKKSKLR